MDHDPDIALPSVETREQTGTSLSGASTVTSRSERFREVSRSESLPPRAVDTSPLRTQFRTPRTTKSSPARSPVSRSSSVASIRHDRSSTPKLDKKRSVPNLPTRSLTPAHQPQFRRASSNLNPATTLRPKAMEKPPMTPASVAKEYFERELQSHSRTTSEVVVFTHDACYGHRFSRPRATKSMLGSIVERPERIRATLLGASTAYVRLGARHKDGTNVPHPDRKPVAPPFTLFRTHRSIPLNHPAVTAVHGNKWMESLQLMCDTAEAKLAMGQKELARPIGHTKDSKGNTLPPLHSGDLYLASESLAALQGCLGGVCDAVDTVFQEDILARRAFVCIRPPGHHCSAEMPSGFCWLNNVHVGVAYAAMNHGLTHAAIIDFDLHHGDGSQTIAWDHNRDAQNMLHPKNAPVHKKTPIGYYSLHDINSYPCEYGDEDKIRNASTCLHTAHGQSIWNVHLEPWSTLTDFWSLYESKYKILLDKASSFLEYHSNVLRQTGVEPKAAIFLSAGFDASQWEGEGMQRHAVNVPTDFYAKITADVVELSQRPDLGVDGRVISVLEGGYSDRALTSGVLSHLCGLTSKSNLNVSVIRHETNELEAFAHDPAWWHPDQLEALEAMVAGNLPQPTQKSKDISPSSYLSPTHASTAKMTDTAKERRSLSAQLEARLAFENAPPEPVPEVDWVTAAYELSRLLIPEDRQTLSCTHDELNAENSRARRDRQSLAGIPKSDPVEEYKRMQLRDRKPKQAIDAVQPRAASRSASRRTTIAGANELPEPLPREPPRTRRRSSAASSVLSGFNDLKIDANVEFSNGQIPPKAGSAAPQHPGASLPTKRTRAPARTSKPVSAANSPRKPRVDVPPSSYARTQSRTMNEFPPPATLTSSNATSGQDSNMDDLTNGMKKISIKLKMPTKEQHDANAKLLEVSGGTRGATTRKPPVPKTSRATVAPVTYPGAMQHNNPSTPAAFAATNANAYAGHASHPAPSVSAGYISALPATMAPQSLQYASPQSARTMTTLDFLTSNDFQPGRSFHQVSAVPDMQNGPRDGRPLQDAPEAISYPSIHMQRASMSPHGSDVVTGSQHESHNKTLNNYYTGH
ncbi:histone deacetylase [Lithohypha guttulata]|uniref:Histone deacetylase n=1 Tax=Lithohypha guttulata TaxID=1690604 RepID=A0AAN7SU09_9EURO|nr:histone deacetylase [Lithohypha guttulata]